VVHPTVTNVLAPNNPSFERATISDYVPFRGTVARGIAGGAAHKTTYLTLTCTTAGNMTVLGPRKPAVPGSQWASGVVFRWRTGATRRSCRADVLFQNGAGAEIGFGLGAGITPTTTEFSPASREAELNGVLVAPAGTETVQWRIAVVAATVGDAVDIDMAQLEPSDNLPAYNDNDDPTEPLDRDPGNPGDLAKVQPMSAQELHDRVGINTMFNKNLGVHVYKSANQPAAFNLIKEASFFHIRGNAGNAATRESVADNARARGLKMVWIVDEESGTAPSAITALTEIRDMIHWIAAYAPDVTYAIEGLNEPNHNRADNTTTPGWENVAYEHQKVVWDYVRGTLAEANRSVTNGWNPATQQHEAMTINNKARLAHVKLVGPSLHDDRARNENLAANPPVRTGYATLASTGIAPYFDYLGLHAYAGGRVPSDRLDSRLALIRAAGAFGPNARVFATEVGYHDAVMTPKGHWPAPPDIIALYAPRLIIQMAGRKPTPPAGVGVAGNSPTWGHIFTDITWFELLDDRDPTINTDQEANFGIIDVPNDSDANATNPTLWTRKPSFDAMKEFLNRLDDPGTPYTPSPIGLELSYDTSTTAAIRHFVVRKRGTTGQAWLFLFREVSLWNVGGPFNNTTGSRTNPASYNVIVKDGSGTRTIPVGGGVSVVSLTA
jgi:hypothetical protein